MPGGACSPPASLLSVEAIGSEITGRHAQDHQADGRSLAVALNPWRGRAQGSDPGV